jgi:hypothetical protein
LDPVRQAYRSDILVSVVIEVLASRGERTTTELGRVVNQIWRTRAITEPEVTDAVTKALSAKLVRRVADLGNVEKWQASPGAIEDSRKDAEWAQRVLAKLQSDVAERLSDLGHDLKLAQANKVAQYLQRALAAGCDIGAGVSDDGCDRLRPVHFDLKPVQHKVDKVTPGPVQPAVQDLVSPATDPDDDFANELIHMLMVGAVLQSFLSKRDLRGRPELEEAHLLLDSSALEDLVDDGEPQQSVMSNLVSLSLRLGTQVFVAEYSLSEWDGLWLGAEQEQPWKLDNEAVPQNIDRLASGRPSPFIKQFLRQKAHEPELTWQRFASQRRNIRGRLQSLGVTIRPAGNTSDEDQHIATGVAAALRGLSADERVRGKRTRTTAAADGESAAMVARWRIKYTTTNTNYTTTSGGKGGC